MQTGMKHPDNREVREQMKQIYVHHWSLQAEVEIVETVVMLVNAGSLAGRRYLGFN